MICAQTMARKYIRFVQDANYCYHERQPKSVYYLLMLDQLMVALVKVNFVFCRLPLCPFAHTYAHIRVSRRQRLQSRSN